MKKGDLNGRKTDQDTSLIETIRGAEAELEELFGGSAKKERKPLTCSKCGGENHTARTCPDKMPQAQL
jgi:hypothetical protein